MIHYLTFLGLDGFDRLVFKDQNNNYYKTILIYPKKFNEFSYETQIDFINQSSLHTTDSPDGEPNFPVKNFKYIYIPNCSFCDIVDGDCVIDCHYKERVDNIINVIN